MSILNVNSLRTTTIQHTNGTTAQTIDSSGRVFRPNQPAVRATSSTLSGDRWISYSAEYNIGSNFDVSTGIFTCPLTGVYIISALYSSTSGVVERNIGHLWINNVIQGEWVESYGAFDDTTGIQLRRLNTNDTIQIGVNTGFIYNIVALQIYFLG
jgi:hypothetical protein